MSDFDEQEYIKPVSTMYYFNQRIATYSAISFTTMMGCVIPGTQILSGLVMAGYAAFLMVQTFQNSRSTEKETNNIKKALRWSFIDFSQDWFFFIFAVTVGLVLGLG
jgi:flagellar biosynthesis component FlhA